MARGGVDIAAGNHSWWRRAFSPVLTMVANTSQGPDGAGRSADPNAPCLPIRCYIHCLLLPSSLPLPDEFELLQGVSHWPSFFKKSARRSPPGKASPTRSPTGAPSRCIPIIPKGLTRAFHTLLKENRHDVFQKLLDAEIEVVDQCLKMEAESSVFNEQTSVDDLNSWLRSKSSAEVKTRRTDILCWRGTRFWWVNHSQANLH